MANIAKQDSLNLEKILTDENWQNQLLNFKKLYQSKFQIAFSTSFSIEDQLLTDFLAKNNFNIKFFTLDTGKLFAQTLKLKTLTEKKYSIKIKSYFPDPDSVRNYIKSFGEDGIYKNRQLRLECCNIRKIAPLNIALENIDIWLVGLRKSQSQSRHDLTEFSWDAQRNLIKFSPIMRLTDKEIWQYIKANNVPYNPLYDQGYTSIGCKPCTRINTNKDDPRSGRWWWENNIKECGIHLVDGKLIRK